MLQIAFIARSGVNVMSSELEQVLVTRVGRFSFRAMKYDSPISLTSWSSLWSEFIRAPQLREFHS